MSNYLLGAKLVVGIHLLLILFLKVEEPLKLPPLQQPSHCFHGHGLLTTVLRTIYDIVASIDVLPYVTPHALLTERMLASLLAINLRQHIANGAQNLLLGITMDYFRKFNWLNAHLLTGGLQVRLGEGHWYPS
jgi:hypothetical protein